MIHHYGKQPKLQVLTHSLERTRYSGRPLEFIRGLPHGVLHTHGGVLVSKQTAARKVIERAGSVRTERGKTLTNEHDVLAWLNERLPQGSLSGYLHRYHQISNPIFTNPEDIYECINDGAEDYASHGTRILEVRTAIKSGPFGDLWRSRHGHAQTMTPEQEFDAVLKALHAAERSKHIKTCVTICIRRSETPERAMQIVTEAHRLRQYAREKFGRDDIVAIDFIGEERNFPLKPFAPVVRYARSLGFRITAHAGEAHFGSVNQALINLGIGTEGKGRDRIGHGTALPRKPSFQLPEDFRVYKNGRDKNPVNLLEGVMFEACLISNLICEAHVATELQIHNDQFDGTAQYWGQNQKGEWILPVMQPMTDPKQYPFKTILAYGGMVCFNPDGNCTLASPSEEWATASEAFDLGAKELLTLAYHSIIHSFIDDDTKAEVIKNHWRPIAALFFCNTLAYDSPELEMEAFLKEWRRKLLQQVTLERYPYP